MHCLQVFNPQVFHLASFQSAILQIAFLLQTCRKASAFRGTKMFCSRLLQTCWTFSAWAQCLRNCALGGQWSVVFCIVSFEVSCLFRDSVEGSPQDTTGSLPVTGSPHLSFVNTYLISRFISGQSTS